MNVYRSDNHIKYVVPFMNCLDELTAGIPSGIQIDIQLTIGKARFYMLQFNPTDETKYQLNLTSANFHIPVVHINKVVWQAIDEHWRKLKTLTFYYRQIEVIHHRIPTNAEYFQVSNFQNNATPNLVFVGFVPTAGVEGQYFINPFSFRKFFSTHEQSQSVNRNFVYYDEVPNTKFPFHSSFGRQKSNFFLQKNASLKNLSQSQVLVGLSLTKQFMPTNINLKDCKKN
jgi:hypothetical protein